MRTTSRTLVVQLLSKAVSIEKRVSQHRIQVDRWKSQREVLEQKLAKLQERIDTSLIEVEARETEVSRLRALAADYHAE